MSVLNHWVICIWGVRSIRKWIFSHIRKFSFGPNNNGWHRIRMGMMESIFPPIMCIISIFNVKIFDSRLIHEAFKIEYTLLFIIQHLFAPHEIIKIFHTVSKSALNCHLFLSHDLRPDDVFYTQFIFTCAREHRESVVILVHLLQSFIKMYTFLPSDCMQSCWHSRSQRQKYKKATTKLTMIHFDLWICNI